MYVVKISLFMQASDGDKVKTLVKYNAKTTSFFHSGLLQTEVLGKPELFYLTYPKRKIRSVEL